MVQQRNLVYLEFQHDLENLINEAGFFKPLRGAGISVKYRLVGRIMYEGVYDYGPQQFQDVRELNKEVIDDFKKEAELWEGYVDIDRGALFVRFGLQNLAWGETDVFRLLDGNNPLDNTYGGIFEGLVDIYRDVGILNRGFCNRLKNVGPEDGCVNAVIILDCFAKSVLLSVNQEMIREIEASFSAYFE